MFCNNLPANELIPEKAGQHLQETITGFYDVVYQEINRIHQLALYASIRVNQASELKRQLLFLSENLNRVKVALALNQGLSSEIWQNVYCLVDQIKMNIREINFSITRLFSCDVMDVIQKTIRNFQIQHDIPISLPLFEGTEDGFLVCIKAAELTAIIENLLQNARRAMSNQSNPQVQISYHQNDQHLFLEVQDNGCGIPKKMWQKIFDQNFSTKDDGKGGFGLYFSREKLEKYGGNIEVQKA